MTIRRFTPIHWPIPLAGPVLVRVAVTALRAALATFGAPGIWAAVTLLAVLRTRGAQELLEHVHHVLLAWSGA